ncbi:MAG: GDSL-type esterase/lipase family protein, partial [Polyangiaceae bacterium]
MRRALFLGLMALAACVPSRDAPSHRSSASVETPLPPLAAGVSTTTGAPLLASSPIVSRGKHVTDSSTAKYSRPENAVDGDPSTSWSAGSPTPNAPASLAIDVGSGPTRLLLDWSAGGSYNYNETDYGSPGAYRIETSADSTNGKDGSWTLVADDPAVDTHGAERSFDFAGRRWVRFVVTAAPSSSPNGVQIDGIDVHDVSAGATDTWFFMGDSITAFAFGNSCPKGKDFASLIHEKHPRYYPTVINGGIGGETSQDGVRHIDDWIAKNHDVHFWVVAYGTNDAAGDDTDAAHFKSNLQTIVRHLKEAGRVPILPLIPYATDGKHIDIARLNAVIMEIADENSLP